MSSLFQRGNVFYAQFTDTRRQPPKRRFSLGTRERRTAERLLGRLDDAYERGTFDPWEEDPDRILYPERYERPLIETNGKAPSPEEVRDAFLARPGLRPATTRSYREVFSLAFEEAPVLTTGHALLPEQVQDVLEPQLRTFLAARRPTTAATYARHLSPLFTAMVEAGTLPYNPLAKGHPLARFRNPGVTPEPTFFTRDEIEAIRKKVSADADEPIRSLLLLVLDTLPYLGLRRREARLLQVRHVDREAHRVVLRAETTKARVAQTVYVPEAARPALYARAEALAKLPRGPRRHVYGLGDAEQPVSGSYLTHTFLEWRRAAGVDHGSLHTLRHTCASWLAQAGIPSNVIQSHLRHAGIEVTQRYMHLAPSHEATLLERGFQAPGKG